MSTWFDEQVTCPSCGHEQTAKLARGVHVARAPEAREQVLDRTFHRVTCANCAVRFVANRELVYTDMDRKHWVQVALVDARPLWPELEQTTRAVFDRAFIGSPMAADLRDGFKVRLVFGVEELREKLVIWRAGFDDSLLECVKLELIKAEPALALASRLLVDAIDDAGADINVLEDEPVRSVRVSRDVIEQAHDAAEQHARYLPELFKGPFVSTHRLLGPRYR